MNTKSAFSPDALKFDVAAAADNLAERIRDVVFHRLRRKGAVLGLSGGVDSSVTAALCAHALGKERVFGILMPEGESSDDSALLAEKLAAACGIETVVENIGPALEAVACYQRRDDAIRRVIPEYGRGWKSKIVLPSIADSPHYQVFSVVAQSPSGELRRVRLSPDAYLGI